MCFFSTPKMAPPEKPPEYAQMRQPDGAAVRSSTSRRTMDRMRAGVDTILTSGSGVSTFGETNKKILLGQ